MIRRAACLAILSPAMLVACGPSDSDPGPGGVTVGEARELDEAAKELEARRLPDGVLDDAATESEPASTN